MAQELKHRPDYTQSFNRGNGRHGWIRLTPAYSVKMVERILTEKQGGAATVLDPFCGSGTTALCAANRGLDAATTDINPFLVWLANAKLASYSAKDVREFSTISKSLGSLKGDAVDPPSIFNIGRWWDADTMRWLCGAKGKIDSLPVNRRIKDLLYVAFCRSVIETSNAAFNHQSMSFKAERRRPVGRGLLNGKFASLAETIAAGARDKAAGRARALLCDARMLDGLSGFKADLVITSPPYANRMSYIRELRPYMYWMGFLTEAREAGELDWRAIGGTWGSATSRLKAWEATGGFSSRRLAGAVKSIRSEDRGNAELLSRYVAKYHDDMFSHFSSLAAALNPGAELHYIVGNSTFYGHLVSVEEIYADMLRELDFAEVGITPLRRRNSKKALVEFDVSARYPGPGRGGLRRSRGA